MAHILSNEKTVLAIEHEHESLFELLPNDGSGFSIIRQLWDKFYGSMTISAGMLPQFREELTQIKQQYVDAITPKMRRENNVTATDPELISNILSRLFEHDRIHSILDQLIGLCDESIESSQSINCLGD